MAIFGWIKKGGSKFIEFSRLLAKYFTTGKAAQDAELAMEYVGKALPYVKIAGDVIVTLTPTMIDDVAWVALKTKYPSFFDGRQKTSDEMKHAALAVATELLMQKYPDLSVSVAKAAAQLAYLDWKSMTPVMKATFGEEK